MREEQRTYQVAHTFTLSHTHTHTHTLTFTHSHLPTLTLSQEEVLYKYFELRDQEIARQKSMDSQLRNELYVTVKRWRGTRRFFTGERGAWSSRFVGGRGDDNWCSVAS